MVRKNTRIIVGKGKIGFVPKSPKPVSMLSIDKGIATVWSSINKRDKYGRFGRTIFTKTPLKIKRK